MLGNAFSGNLNHKFEIFLQDFFSKCVLRIWSHLLKRSFFVRYRGFRENSGNTLQRGEVTETEGHRNMLYH